MNIFYSFISITAFLIAPKDYSLIFNILVTFFFLLQTIPFIIKKSKSNFINFYSLFFTSYFFVNFFYPSILYPIDPYYFSIFNKSFNHDVINKATALALLSSSCFILGVSLIRDAKRDGRYPMLSVFNHLPVTLLAFILYFIFIATVGTEFLSGNFTAQSVFSQYVLPLVTCSFTLSSIIFFRNYQYQTKKLFFYCSIASYILLFLSIGDRGPALSLIIIIIALYSQYIKKVKLIVIIPLGFLGMLLMHLIGDGRSADGLISNENIITRGLNNFDFNLDGYYQMTLDFVVNAWTLYTGVDYVQHNGINWGATFPMFLLGVFPFSQSFVESTFNIKLEASSQIFTNIGLGDNATWGLGTNIISSVYISFGLAGCIVLFIGLGALVEKSRIKTLYKNTISANILYFSLIGFAIYYPRSDILEPLKFIAWTYLIYILLRNFGWLKRKNLEAGN